MERGERRPPDLVVSPEKKQSLKEDHKWFVTFYHSSFAQGIKYLRLSERISSNEFEKEIESAQGHLYKYEQEQDKPYIFIVNKIIDASPINPDGKAAYLLRLKHAGEDIMDNSRLRNCHPGELVRTLRLQRGITQKELGIMLGLPQTQISKLEKGTRQLLQRDTIREKFISWLNIAPNSPLAELLTLKAQDPDAEPNAAFLKAVASGPYLFGNHHENKNHYKLLPEEQALLEEISSRYTNENITINTIFRMIRAKQNRSRTDIVQASKNRISLGQIQNIENKPDIPLDDTIVLYTQCLSLTIHHPLTHLILDIAEQERKKKHSGRRKQR